MLIGLCGKAGSGKTSVARYLEEKYNFERVSFAGPLKRMAMDIWGFSEEQVFGEADIKETVDPRWDISPRTAMQKLGQAARDHLWPTIWADSLFRYQERAIGKRVAIEDVRYGNEFALIKQHNGIVVKLICQDSISTDDGTHPSEAQVDLIQGDATLVSSRELGLDHLFGLVDEFLSSHL